MRIENPEKHPRLALSVPGEWALRHIGPNLHESIVDDDVTMQVRAMVAPTIEHTEWIEGIMLEHMAPGCRLRRLALEPTTSHFGWPVVFAHYDVLDLVGDKVEERAGAFYRIVHNRAEVVVRLRNGVSWADRAEELRPIIMHGHVEWPSYEHDLLYTLLGFHL
jgi:hypothetical protein